MCTAGECLVNAVTDRTNVNILRQGTNIDLHRQRRPMNPYSSRKLTGELDEFWRNLVQLCVYKRSGDWQVVYFAVAPQSLRYRYWRFDKRAWQTKSRFEKLVIRRVELCTFLQHSVHTCGFYLGYTIKSETQSRSSTCFDKFTSGIITAVLSNLTEDRGQTK
jgi:hypothetical protein